MTASVASDMHDCITPSVLLSETHFAHRTEKGTVADAVARIAGGGFYRGIEIADVADAGDRRRIGEAVRGNGLMLTQWMSMVLSTEKLNLSAIDERIRKRSIGRMLEFIEPAVECGARSFAILPGPDPGPAFRSQATEQLYRSCCELCAALAKHPPMLLLIEPLDRDAHKNGLIGPTSEAKAFVARVRATSPGMAISWDTAHAALCGEDVIASMLSAKDSIAQIHLANAVLERTDPLFGDHHREPGAPGFLTVQFIARLLDAGSRAGLFGDRKPGVSVEIRTPEAGDPWETEARGRKALEQAWLLASRGRLGG